MSDVIYRREWPVSDAKAAVLIAHGLAEHSGRYEYVAGKLNEAGYAVYAYDHRGHGRSIGFPGDFGGEVDAVIQDVVDQVILTKQAHDKVFLLAHSMGTLLSIPAVPHIEAGVLAGFIISGTPIVPGTAAVESMTTGEGLPPESISRDPAIVQAYVDDPLVFNDAVPPELMGHLLETFQKVEAAIPLIEMPVLLIHGSEDLLGSVEGPNRLHAELVISGQDTQGVRGPVPRGLERARARHGHR